MNSINVAVITITKSINTDGQIDVDIESSTPDGDALDILEVLGLMEFGKAEVLRRTMEDDDE